MGPILDGAREAGPVDPADAWRDGRQLSLAAPVAEPPACRGDILLGRWESGSQGRHRGLGGPTQTTREDGADLGAPEARDGDGKGARSQGGR